MQQPEPILTEDGLRVCRGFLNGMCIGTIMWGAAALIARALLGAG